VTVITRASGVGTQSLAVRLIGGQALALCGQATPYYYGPGLVRGGAGAAPRFQNNKQALDAVARATNRSRAAAPRSCTRTDKDTLSYTDPLILRQRPLQCSPVDQLQPVVQLTGGGEAHVHATHLCHPHGEVPVTN